MQLQPILCGAAFARRGRAARAGCGAVLSAEPARHAPVEGEAVGEKKKKPGDEVKKISRKPKSPNRSAASSSSLAHENRRHSWVRVYSGSLKSNSRVLNPSKNEKENVRAVVAHFMPRRRKNKSTTSKRAIVVGIIGLRHSITGDTLCDTRDRFCSNRFSSRKRSFRWRSNRRAAPSARS